jgi:hypothetical protein
MEATKFKIEEKEKWHTKKQMITFDRPTKKYPSRDTIPLNKYAKDWMICY